MARFLAVDLFCGAGGLTAGLKQSGFDVIAGVELDEAAAETYAVNNRKARVFNRDISDICPEEFLRDFGLEVGELDLLAGCPPCQGFSSHRTRNKATTVLDSRNDLIFEFLRFVKAVLPKTILMENVPGLAKDSRIKVFKCEIKELGYYVDAETVKVEDASDYGVPQRRKRMILKASRYGSIANPSPVKKKKTVRDAIGCFVEPGDSGDELHDLSYKRNKRVVEIIKMIPKDGGSRLDLSEEYWLPCHKRNPGGYRDVYGRMSWDDVSPTITGGCHNPSKGRFLHPEQDRAITLREAAILQTFPDDYKFSLRKGKDSVALMIGNAIPPQLIKVHAKTFYDHLKGLA